MTIEASLERIADELTKLNSYLANVKTTAAAVADVPERTKPAKADKPKAESKAPEPEKVETPAEPETTEAADADPAVLREQAKKAVIHLCTDMAAKPTAQKLLKDHGAEKVTGLADDQLASFVTAAVEAGVPEEVLS